MTDVARFLIIVGALLTVAGVCLYALGKVPWLGRLPGDIAIKNENFSVFIPLTTCLLLSLFLSLAFFLWNQR